MENKEQYKDNEELNEIYTYKRKICIFILAILFIGLIVKEYRILQTQNKITKSIVADENLVKAIINGKYTKGEQWCATYLFPVDKQQCIKQLDKYISKEWQDYNKEFNKYDNMNFIEYNKLTRCFLNNHFEKTTLDNLDKCYNEIKN